MLGVQATKAGVWLDAASLAPLGRVGRALCVVLMVFAIVHVGARRYLQPEWSTDKVLQAASTKNFIAGEGLGYYAVPPHDLANIQFLPLYQWPPGYTFLLALPLLAGTDINVAGILVDCLGIVVFFVSWWVILRELGNNLGELGRLLLWVLWAATLAPLLDTSTGILALAFYSAGLALMLRALVRVDHGTWLGIASGLCVGASAWLRYAFWPLGIVMPLSLAYAACRYDRRYWRTAALNAVSFGLALGALILVQKSETGSATYLSVYYAPETRQGLWFEQLLKTCPFPTHVFRCDEALDHKLASLSAQALEAVKWSLAGLVVLVFALELWRNQRLTARETGDMEPRIGAVFYVAGGLTALLTFAMLAYLTVRHCNPAIDRWTYVQEMRYYAPALVFFSVALCAWATSAPTTIAGVLKLCLAVALLYFPANVFAQPKNLLNSCSTLVREGSFDDLYFGKKWAPFTKQLERLSQGAEHVVYLEDPKVCTTGQRYALAALQGIGYTLHHDDNFIGKLRTDRRVRVIALAPPFEGQQTPLQELLQRRGARLEAHFEAWKADLYVFDLEPE